VKVSQELEQCKNDFQVQSNCVVRLEQQLASAKVECVFTSTRFLNLLLTSMLPILFYKPILNILCGQEELRESKDDNAKVLCSSARFCPVCRTESDDPTLPEVGHGQQDRRSSRA
jgi:hypothetical protein